MSTKHTSGPFRVGEHCAGLAINAPDGARIASLSYGAKSVSVKIPIEQTAANAALFAAAPELLAAALLLIAAADEGNSDKAMDGYDALRVAIAKAKAKASGDPDDDDPAYDNDGNLRAGDA